MQQTVRVTRQLTRLVRKLRITLVKKGDGTESYQIKNKEDNFQSLETTHKVSSRSNSNAKTEDSCDKSDNSTESNSNSDREEEGCGGIDSIPITKEVLFQSLELYPISNRSDSGFGTTEASSSEESLSSNLDIQASVNSDSALEYTNSSVSEYDSTKDLSNGIVLETNNYLKTQRKRKSPFCCKKSITVENCGNTKVPRLEFSANITITSPISVPCNNSNAIARNDVINNGDKNSNEQIADFPESEKSNKPITDISGKDINDCNGGLGVNTVQQQANTSSEIAVSVSATNTELNTSNTEYPIAPESGDKPESDNKIWTNVSQCKEILKKQTVGIWNPYTASNDTVSTSQTLANRRKEIEVYVPSTKFTDAYQVAPTNNPADGIDIDNSNNQTVDNENKTNSNTKLNNTEIIEASNNSTGRTDFSAQNNEIVNIRPNAPELENPPYLYQLLASRAESALNEPNQGIAHTSEIAPYNLTGRTDFSAHSNQTVNGRPNAPGQENLQYLHQAIASKAASAINAPNQRIAHTSEIAPYNLTGRTDFSAQNNQTVNCRRNAPGQENLQYLHQAITSRAAGIVRPSESAPYNFTGRTDFSAQNNQTVNCRRNAPGQENLQYLHQAIGSRAAAIARTSESAPYNFPGRTDFSAHNNQTVNCRPNAPGQENLQYLHQAIASKAASAINAPNQRIAHTSEIAPYNLTGRTDFSAHSNQTVNCRPNAPGQENLQYLHQAIGSRAAAIARTIESAPYNFPGRTDFSAHNNQTVNCRPNAPGQENLQYLHQAIASKAASAINAPNQRIAHTSEIAPYNLTGRTDFSAHSNQTVNCRPNAPGQENLQYLHQAIGSRAAAIARTIESAPYNFPGRTDFSAHNNQTVNCRPNAPGQENLQYLHQAKASKAASAINVANQGIAHTSEIAPYNLTGRTDFSAHNNQTVNCRPNAPGQENLQYLHQAKASKAASAINVANQGIAHTSEIAPYNLTGRTDFSAHNNQTVNCRPNAPGQENLQYLHQAKASKAASAINVANQGIAHTSEIAPYNLTGRTDFSAHSNQTVNCRPNAPGQENLQYLHQAKASKAASAINVANQGIAHTSEIAPYNLTGRTDFSAHSNQTVNCRPNAPGQENLQYLHQAKASKAASAINAANQGIAHTSEIAPYNLTGRTGFSAHNNQTVNCWPNAPGQENLQYLHQAKASKAASAINAANQGIAHTSEIAPYNLTGRTGFSAHNNQTVNCWPNAPGQENLQYLHQAIASKAASAINAANQGIAHTSEIAPYNLTGRTDFSAHNNQTVNCWPNVPGQVNLQYLHQAKASKAASAINAANQGIAHTSEIAPYNLTGRTDFSAHNNQTVNCWPNVPGQVNLQYLHQAKASKAASAINAANQGIAHTSEIAPYNLTGRTGFSAHNNQTVNCWPNVPGQVNLQYLHQAKASKAASAINAANQGIAHTSEIAPYNLTGRTDFSAHNNQTVNCWPNAPGQKNLQYLHPPIASKAASAINAANQGIAHTSEIAPYNLTGRTGFSAHNNQTVNCWPNVPGQVNLQYLHQAKASKAASAINAANQGIAHTSEIAPYNLTGRTDFSAHNNQTVNCWPNAPGQKNLQYLHPPIASKAASAINAANQGIAHTSEIAPYNLTGRTGFSAHNNQTVNCWPNAPGQKNLQYLHPPIASKAASAINAANQGIAHTREIVPNNPAGRTDSSADNNQIVNILPNAPGQENLQYCQQELTPRTANAMSKPVHGIAHTSEIVPNNSTGRTSFNASKNQIVDIRPTVRELQNLCNIQGLASRTRRIEIDFNVANTKLNIQTVDTSRHRPIANPHQCINNSSRVEITSVREWHGNNTYDNYQNTQMSQRPQEPGHVPCLQCVTIEPQHNGATMVTSPDLLTPLFTPMRNFKKQLLQLHEQQQRLELAAAAATTAAAAAQVPQAVPTAPVDDDRGSQRSTISSNRVARKRTILDRDCNSDRRQSILERVPEVSPDVFLEDIRCVNESVRERLRSNGSETIALGSKHVHKKWILQNQRSRNNSNVHVFSSFLESTLNSIPEDIQGPHVRDELLHSKRMRSEIPTSVLTPPAEPVSSEPLPTNNYLNTVEPISDDECPPADHNINQEPIMMRASEPTTIADMEEETIVKVHNPFEPELEKIEWIVSTSMEDDPECENFVDRMQVKLNKMYHAMLRLIIKGRVCLHETYCSYPSLPKILVDLSYLQRNGYKYPKGEKSFEKVATQLLKRLLVYANVQDIASKDELLASLILIALKYNIMLPRILDGYTLILNGDSEQIVSLKNELIQRYERHKKEEGAKALLATQKKLGVNEPTSSTVQLFGQNHQVSVIKSVKEVQDEAQKPPWNPKNGKDYIKQVIPTIVLSDSEDEEDTHDDEAVNSVQEGSTELLATGVTGEKTNSTTNTDGNSILYNFQKCVEDVDYINTYDKPNRSHNSTDIGQKLTDNDVALLNLHKPPSIQQQSQTTTQRDYSEISDERSTTHFSENAMTSSCEALPAKSSPSTSISSQIQHTMNNNVSSHNRNFSSRGQSEDISPHEELSDRTIRTLRVSTSSPSTAIRQKQHMKSNNNAIQNIFSNEEEEEEASRPREFQRQTSINPQSFNGRLKQQNNVRNSGRSRNVGILKISDDLMPSSILPSNEPVSLLEKQLKKTNNLSNSNNVVDNQRKQHIQMRPLSDMLNSSSRTQYTADAYIFSENTATGSTTISHEMTSSKSVNLPNSRDGRTIVQRQLSQLSNASGSSGSANVSDKSDTLLPEEYVQEVNNVLEMNIPEDFKYFYEFVTKSQITNGNAPISFNTFLELHNAGNLKTFQKKYSEYLMMKEGIVNCK